MDDLAAWTASSAGSMGIRGDACGVQKSRGGGSGHDVIDAWVRAGWVYADSVLGLRSRWVSMLLVQAFLSPIRISFWNTAATHTNRWDQGDAMRLISNDQQSLLQAKKWKR